MGFKARKTYVLKFDGDLEGLHIRARGVTVDEAIEADAALRSDDDARQRELIGWFASRITEWNLEDDDGAVLPITAESLTGAIDQDYVQAALVAWLDAVRGRPSAPLSESSSGGEPPPELSLPMEPVSPSLAS